MAQGLLTVLKKSPTTEALMRNWHVDLGLAYGPNGLMISRQESDETTLVYDNKLGLRFDPDRYPRALNQARKLAFFLPDSERTAQLNSIEKAYRQRAVMNAKAIPLPSSAKLVAARGGSLTMPRTLQRGRRLGLSDVVTRLFFAPLPFVEFHRIYWKTDAFVDEHNEDGRMSVAEIARLRKGINLIWWASIIMPVLVFVAEFSYGGNAISMALLSKTVAAFFAGNMIAHSAFNAYLLAAPTSEQRVLSKLENVSDDKMVSPNVLAAILPLVMPHAETIGLKNALNARASAHLITELRSDKLTGRRLAEILPLLLYLQKPGTQAVDLNNEQAPRLEISYAKNVQEANAILDRMRSQAQATGGKILLALDGKVLKDMALSQKEIDVYAKLALHFMRRFRIETGFGKADWRSRRSCWFRECGRVAKAPGQFDGDRPSYRVVDGARSQTELVPARR